MGSLVSSVAFGCFWLFLLLFVTAEASEASEQSERAKLSGAARAGADMNFWMSEVHAWSCTKNDSLALHVQKYVKKIALPVPC